MNYDEFSEEVRRGVETLIQSTSKDSVALVRTITKNNNIRLRAISIVRKDEPATPTIYIRHYYDDYKKGRSISDICEEIFQTYETGIKKFTTDFNPQDFLYFDKIKDRIFYKIINYKMNEKVLKTLPHFRFLDMAIVFYIMISCDEESQATALIHYIHMENWGVGVSDLKALAFKNTQKQYPPVIKEMEDIISEMIIKQLIDDEDNNTPSDSNSAKGKRLKSDSDSDTGDSSTNIVSENCTPYNTDSCAKHNDSFCYDFSYENVRNIIEEEVEKLKADRELNMYVLTNNIRTNGATCITYPDILKDFAEEHQSDIYIIPSSIHEVILIPESNLDMEEFNQIIAEVNQKELDPTEVLSDHMYLYSRREGEILY